jgi:hypothetical protein
MEPSQSGAETSLASAARYTEFSYPRSVVDCGSPLPPFPKTEPLSGSLILTNRRDFRRDGFGLNDQRLKFPLGSGFERRSIIGSRPNFLPAIIGQF